MLGEGSVETVMGLKMESRHAVLFLFLLLFCSVHSYRFRGRSAVRVRDPESEWEKMKTITSGDKAEAPAPEPKLWRSGSAASARRVPEYVVVSAAEDQKEVFKPEKGARPLPNSVKDMLLRTAAPPQAPPSTTRRELVEVLCHVDRIYVRIRREVFKTLDAYKYLRLGTCPVNQGTKEHYYFLYSLKGDCGFKTESNVDYRTVKTALSYKPTTPVLREMPFEVPLQCKYPRFFHSYKCGIHPRIQGGTVHKTLQSSSFTLIILDASGNEITGAKIFTLGRPVYFEARCPDNSAASGAQRLYISKCFMTVSQNPNSNPKYTVIDNRGCMIDSKVTQQSKFLTGASTMAQKFSVDAMIFKDMDSASSPQQLFMHCEIYLGTVTPTESSKACNYDSESKNWMELYGDDSVCTCCDSTCSSIQPKAATRTIISSPSWEVGVSSNNKEAEGVPQIKAFSPDTVHVEDQDMTEHSDFLSYWDDDLKNL